MNTEEVTEIPGVRSGADVLARGKCALLSGARVGLITNHTGRTQDGTATADLLHNTTTVQLKTFFGPEHGIRGEVDERVSDGKDAQTGLPVYSLYGPRQEPTTEQLTGLDTLVYDIQDVGCRFYTYLSTLGHCLHAAAKHKLRFVVLDRPNPIGGVAVEGPVADSDRLSFTAYHRIPVRHGMTLGEMATLLNRERGYNATLVVVRCEGWKRKDYWDATNLTWVNPSPNMRSATQALLYPGIGLMEFTNISVGRGTDTPFEIFGAPYIQPRELAHALNEKRLPGIRFVPYGFTPVASKFARERCGGVQMVVTDRAKLTPVRLGFTIFRTLMRLYPTAWQPERYLTLLANKSVMDGLRAGEDDATLEKRYAADLQAFTTLRKGYLLYS
jgi:uncharacterized protein YbbC (DUF1343 family)